MGDYLPKCFLDYFFDGERESPSSHFDKMWTLELGFHEEDVTWRQDNVGRLWTNDGSKFLLDLVENKCWEYNSKPFKESNWKESTNFMNGKFSNDATKFWSKFKTNGTKWKRFVKQRIKWL